MWGRTKERDGFWAECEMQPIVCIITHKQRCNVKVVICKVLAWFSIGVGFSLPVCPGQHERSPLSVTWGFLIVDELTKEGGNKISLVEQHFCLRAHHVVTFTRYFQRVQARKYLMIDDKVWSVSNINLSQSVLVPRRATPVSQIPGSCPSPDAFTALYNCTFSPNACFIITQHKWCHKGQKCKRTYGWKVKGKPARQRLWILRCRKCLRLTQ